MKLLFDFFPILLFFIAYKFYGIYVATGVAMVACVLQVAGYWVKNRRFETLHIITLVSILVFGGATLLLHNPLFIKWKPTVIYWIFAGVLFFTQFTGKRPLFQGLMEEKIILPKTTWTKLNASWAIYFIILGAANLFVAYFFSTNAWVNFKLFGTLGCTLLFAAVQGIYIAKHVQNNPENNNNI